MSDVNFNRYPCFLSVKVLDKYHLIFLEKGPKTECVLFCRKYVILNVLAFYLINVYLN